MACFNPLIAFPPRNPDIDKRYKIHGYWLKDPSEHLPFVHSDGEVDMPVKLPCGRCVGCKLDYSRSWADRIVLESTLYPDGYNWFVTLTYDDTALSFSSKVPYATLVPKHITDFIKRLRERFSRSLDHTGIRYYLCGEYGSTTFRPHYHICLLNCPLSDLKYYSSNSRGDVMYNSDLLSELWGFGFVVVAELNYETCAYTARYCLKKVGDTADKAYLMSQGIYPEFVRMSRRPGIASQYFKDNADRLLAGDKLYLPNGDVHTPPRYFEKIIDPELNYEALARYKSRKASLGFQRAEYIETMQGLDPKSYSINSERKLVNSLKSLSREI